MAGVQNSSRRNAHEGWKSDRGALFSRRKVWRRGEAVQWLPASAGTCSQLLLAPTNSVTILCSDISTTISDYSLRKESSLLQESHPTMFPTLVRRLAQSAKEPLAKQVPFTIINNPYKARKVWPPDFKELTHQQQLRFEKKYKRRIALAQHSPRWEKGVKYAQLITIAGQCNSPYMRRIKSDAMDSRIGISSILFRV